MNTTLGVGDDYDEIFWLIADEMPVVELTSR